VSTPVMRAAVCPLYFSAAKRRVAVLHVHSLRHLLAVAVVVVLFSVIVVAVVVVVVYQALVRTCMASLSASSSRYQTCRYQTCAPVVLPRAHEIIRICDNFSHAFLCTSPRSYVVQSASVGVQPA
jgi:hypothetical protein